MNDAAGTVKVTSGTVRGATVLRVEGEVDLHTAPLLRTHLLDWAYKVAGPVFVDLTGVSYMDSSGVGTIVFFKRQVERSGARLVLIGLQPRVRSVLEITHLDRFFTIARSIDEALQA